MSTLGKLIFEKRTQKGLTLDEMFAQTGVSDGAISMIERGKRPRVFSDTLVKLCDKLKITPQQAFDAIRQDIQKGGQ